MSNFKSTSTGVNTIYTSTITKGSKSYVVSSTSVPTFNYDVEVTKLLTDLKDRKGVEVRTSTLYHKFEEINSTYNQNDFLYLSSLSNEIWQPTDVNNLELTINEINSLKPIVVPIPKVNKSLITEWIHFRRMVSTMSYSKGIGRNIKFFIKDEFTGKILGIVELSSDFGSLKVRDNHIGWSKEDRYKKKMLGHTAVGSTIVSVQPFGFNFLGGKLMSMLLTSKVVRDEWENRYGQKLVGITTTSLYGNEGKDTQYDNMKQWIRLGETTGKTFIKPNQEIYNVWKKWLKVNFPKEYDKASTSSAPKQKIIQLVFKKLGLKSKDFHHGYKRGVYFSKFYQNSFEFLKGNTVEVGEEMFDSSVDSLVNSWKKRAIRRFKSLHKKGEIKKSNTFYSNIINLTWEQTLSNYLGLKTETLAPLKTKSVKGFISDTVFNVFLSKSFTNNAKANLIKKENNIKYKREVYILYLNFLHLEIIYFSSYLRQIMIHQIQFE